MPEAKSATNRMLVHELPSAPKFIGRARELHALKEFWQSDDRVLSLIGLGGAGKTALADRFLTWVDQNDSPDKVLVWSFYDDPDANAFLETLYRFISGNDAAEVKGSAWFHLLREQLTGPTRILLILDGLERIQRPTTDGGGIFGELEDPLLRGLLVRIASGKSGAKAVITSRFPVSTLEPYLGRGYRVLDVEQLPREAAKELIEARGIACDEDTLNQVLGTYGSHALTLDILAGAVAEFFQSDFKNLPSDNVLDEPSQRLSHVLHLVESNLSARDRDLLIRLCVFRFGVDSKTLARVFLSQQSAEIAGSLAGATTEELDEILRKQVQRHLVYQEAHQKYTVHPAVRDHFYRLFRDPAHVHEAVARDIDTLTARPGIGLPTDKYSLDLLEELIFHAIQAKSIDEAIEIYFSRMGGNEHLNNNLGEYHRTYRILSAFPECPDPSGLYHCERAFGNFADALKWRPKNRYVLLLNGRLSELSRDESEPTRNMALALMGRSVAIPERSGDFPICSAMAWLLRGETGAARRAAELELGLSMFEDDRARNQLILADAIREDGDADKGAELIESASQWILQSASQEHLFLLHWVRARAMISKRQFDVAANDIAEGLTIAQESGFKLAECLFQILNAMRSFLDPSAILDHEALREAVRLAIECQFDYGIRQCRRLEDEYRASQKAG